jgi:tetratricopeptide (TPR) repeat protein
MAPSFRRHALILIALCAGLFLAARTPAWAAAVDSLLRKVPADSLVLPLRRIENNALRPREAAEAALKLGQLHYARGEYRRAADAFSRAAARLDPARKPEARYWAGMSWLALGDAGQARAVFEEITSGESPRRSEALLGLALAWDRQRRPEKAFEILDPLSREAQGEAAPPVLEQTIRIADRMHRTDAANRARERLVREFPRSMEATRAGLEPARRNTTVVELGPFPSEPRAHQVAEEARRAGFTGAQVMVRPGSDRARAMVQLGEYSTADEARRAADRVRRSLGVPAQLVTQ